MRYWSSVGQLLIGFAVQKDSLVSHPVEITLKNLATETEEVVRAMHLIGADGAASSIREQLGISFDGTHDRYLLGYYGLSLQN